MGHQTTSAIAEKYLTKNTIDNLNKIFKEYVGIDNRTFKSIVEMSTYPDEIRLMIPWSSAFHYVNMNDGATKFDEIKHCNSPNYCIVKALRNYTSILSDRTITSIVRLGEALTFIVHFMGDEFQPLHCGNVEGELI
jgi:hypothetical protein